MLHQAEKERKIGLGDALLIQRENEIAGTGVQQEIRVLHALGDALVGEQFADVVALQKIGELVRGDVGIDRHESVTPPPGSPAAGGAVGR